jgi:hypothetical protein
MDASSACSKALTTWSDSRYDELSYDTSKARVCCHRHITVRYYSVRVRLAAVYHTIARYASRRYHIDKGKTHSKRRLETRVSIFSPTPRAIVLPSDVQMSVHKRVRRFHWSWSYCSIMSDCMIPGTMIPNTGLGTAHCQGHQGKEGVCSHNTVGHQDVPKH